MDREMRIRNYSERTIKSYICSVGQVARYYNLPPSQITIDQFKAHLHHLINNKNCSVSRINQPGRYYSRISLVVNGKLSK
jgi:integrase/recombinase XerD